MARFTQSGGGGGGAELPQGLSTSSSPSFDKIYVTHNSDGTNIQIGDDAWIGDVDNGNMISIQGVQDNTQGGIIFGSALANKISTDGSGMTIEANNGDMNFYMDGGMYIGNSDSNNQIVKMSDLNNVAQRLASGSFYDQNSFGPYTAFTDHAFSMETTAFSNDVHIGGIENTQIVMDRAGKFNIAFSAQFHVTSGAAIAYVWLRKNGTNEPWTNTRYDITANNPYAVAAWNFFVDAQAGDYYEIMWTSSSANVKIEAITGLTGGRPEVPSVIVTVNQVG